MKTKPSKITELEKIAKDILTLKSELGLRRPLVVEFCGSPNSGKTTTIKALNILLKRNDFKTVVINEMAAICPIKQKTDFFFNSWTFFNSMSHVISEIVNGQNNTDIILIDRSLFDALCWFKWLSTNPDENITHISKAQFETFANFLVGTEMWVKHFDLIYIFKTDPDVSLKREFAELLTTKGGSIMNKEVLKQFNDSIDIVKKEYGQKFRKIEEYNTTNQPPNLVGFDVTTVILNNFREILTEKIGYFLDTFKPYLKDGINEYSLISSRSLFFLERHIVENENYIQPIAIAVITDKKRENVLVLKKNEHKATKGSPEHNRYLLYVGGHLRIEDTNGIEENSKVIQRALEREIKEELSLPLTITHNEPFLIYTPINEKSKKHIAVCYVIEMDLENKKFTPSREEFIGKTQGSKSGTVVRVKDLVNNKEELETWSIAIMNHVFKISTSLFD